MLGCFIIPFFVDETKDVKHFCPECEAELGIYKRMWAKVLSISDPRSGHLPDLVTHPVYLAVQMKKYTKMNKKI